MSSIIVSNCLAVVPHAILIRAHASVSTRWILPLTRSIWIDRRSYLLKDKLVYDQHKINKGRSPDFIWRNKIKRRVSSDAQECSGAPGDQALFVMALMEDFSVFPNGVNALWVSRVVQRTRPADQLHVLGYTPHARTEPQTLRLTTSSTRPTSRTDTVALIKPFGGLWLHKRTTSDMCRSL